VSLLLDALKKAAQEKLEKQQKAEQSVDATVIDQGSGPSETQIDNSDEGGVHAPLDESGSQVTKPYGDSASVGESITGMELEPLDKNEDLSLDITAYPGSAPGLADDNTDYHYRRAGVLASELKAFLNSDADVASYKDTPPLNDGADPQYDTASVSMTANMDARQAAYSGSPAQAALLFSSKKPPGESKSNLRLYLLLGVTAVVALLVGGMFVYDYVASMHQSSIIAQRPARPTSPLAELAPSLQETPASSADEFAAKDEVDPALLIEQEDYGSILSDDLATTADEEKLVANTPPVKSAAPKSAPRAVAQRPSFREGDYSIRKTEGEPLHAILMRGYTAYNRGEYEKAEIAYRQALTRSPNNRDALLGMAAVRIAQGDSESAAAYYHKLLERDPKDELAQAALTGLEYGGLQAGASASEESRIKLLLNEKPDSNYLHFTLGNIYAGQRRWAEAQQAYFEAYRLQPDNPDYAFNLAVSLDYLGKRQAAAGYYQQSLQLAQQRKAGFDTAAVAARIAILQTP
jgi:tetratricopeptide (TPR) repeat protein